MLRESWEAYPVWDSLQFQHAAVWDSFAVQLFTRLDKSPEFAAVHTLGRSHWETSAVRTVISRSEGWDSSQ